MKKLIIAFLGVILLAGCGPHKYTSQEIAHQKAQAAAEQQKAKADAAVAAQRKVDAQQKAKEQAAIKHNIDQANLAPLPANVHQIGDARFVANGIGIGSLRHICSGENNNVEDASVQADGSVLVKCHEGVHDFRDETWNNTYNYDKAHGIGMLGVMAGK